MAKYKIAWMPGDGVGVDVMDGARIVLDAMKFDAEYVPCRHRVGVLAQRGQRAARTGP
jgi:isocitrate/isopropylmalate dehydrogenase